jgi:alpha-galactosidase/6-phospho-beta-glucosidase family protein
MSNFKIVVIGAGSYVFGPSLLSQAILENDLGEAELALVDVDNEVLSAMAGVGRRMAQATNKPIEIITHTQHANALANANFVVNMAAPQMHRRFQMDYDVIRELIPDHLVSEFGGIAGISYSLRQIALVQQITDDMRHLCPDAWLLNIANPLPRVCQASQLNGIKTVGFCSVVETAYNMVSQILTGKALDYPFTAGREKYQLTTAGTNHFAWVLELKNRQTGEDLLPQLRERITEGATSGNPVSERLGQETGFLLVPVDDHTRDFLPPDAAIPSMEYPSHGSTDERQRRINVLKQVGTGELDWGVLLEHPAWEHPIEFICALAYNREAYFQSLNLINTGQITNLPSSIFVETPCIVNGTGVHPQLVELPAAVLPYAETTAAVTDTILQAAVQQSRALLYRAVELDPTILDKSAGVQAINRCLEIHQDVLPVYH